MKLSILTRKKKITLNDDDVLKDEFFTKIEVIEVSEIRWESNHQLHFVRKGYAHYERLDDDQELFRLTD